MRFNEALLWNSYKVNPRLFVSGFYLHDFNSYTKYERTYKHLTHDSKYLISLLFGDFAFLN